MKEERFTELDKDDIKRIIPCRQYKWLDDMESEYSEYRFFLEKLKSILELEIWFMWFHLTINIKI